MAINVVYLTAVAAALAALHISYRLFLRVRQAQKAGRLGCQPVVALPQPVWDPLGLQLIVSWAKYAKEIRMLDGLTEMFQLVSRTEGRHVTTFKYGAVGSSKIFTMDPKNIQAVLATQFEDFEIGPHRIGNFMPLLGSGIVSDRQFFRGSVLWW